MSFEDEEGELEKSVETSTSSEEVTKKREVSEMLKNCKDKKVTSWISTYNQLLQLTPEDIASKKQMLKKMEKIGNELRTDVKCWFFNTAKCWSISIKRIKGFLSTHTFS